MVMYHSIRRKTKETELFMSYFVGIYFLPLVWSSHFILHHMFFKWTYQYQNLEQLQEGSQTTNIILKNWPTYIGATSYSSVSVPASIFRTRVRYFKLHLTAFDGEIMHYIIEKSRPTGVSTIRVCVGKGMKPSHPCTETGWRTWINGHGQV